MNWPGGQRRHINGPRGSGLLPYRQIGPARHRFHDAVLAATAQVHGHGLLTKREPVFGAGTQVKVAPS
jgi:hypothetical protein